MRISKMIKSQQAFNVKKCPSCNTMVDYIEGDLPKEKVKQVKKHLAVCQVCREVTKDAIKIKKEVDKEFSLRAAKKKS